MVATAVSTSSNELKIILWRAEENGDVTRLGEAKAAGEITDVACCIAHYDMGQNFLASAVRRVDGTLKVDVWETFANGSIQHRASATAGKINATIAGLNTPRLSISNVGVQSLVTHVRDEDSDLKTILWQFDKSLSRIGSATLDAPSVGNISGCHVARELTIAAIQDKDKKLKLIAYAFPEDGRFITKQGTASAGNISDVAICRIGTEMVMTGVGIGSDKLKLILWQVTQTGDQIIRLDDAATDEGYSRLSMCYADRDQVATALRDGGGNLKIITWRLVGTTPDKEILKPIFNQSQPANGEVTKINLASDDECEVDNS